MLVQKLILKCSVLFILMAFGSPLLAVCDAPSTDLDSAKSRVTSFIQEMKIAKARGDIETMKLSYDRFYLGFLQKCSATDYVKLCGYECHVELGEFNLFMANDLAYYYQKSTSRRSGSPQKPAAVLEAAQNGVDIIEKGIKALLDQPKGDIRDYIYQSGNYQLLLARLYMTMGDLQYQSVSETKLQRLQYLVSNATSGRTDSDGKKTETEQAKEYYESANWAIQSAALEVPLEDQIFSDLAADILSLTYEINRRLTSLDKGYIFLDIDPESFTTIPYHKLKLRLKQLTDRVIEAERNVESLMSAWKQAKLNRDTDQINEEARSKDISITQSSYRIAKLESMANELRIEVDGKLNDVKAKQDSLEYERQKAEYEFGLKSKITELSNRKELIQARTEADVLQFDSVAKERRVNDLRWMMGWEISKANLDIQLSQFQSEIDRFESEIKIKENQIEQNANRRKNIGEQLKIARENIGTSIRNVEALELEKDRLNRLHIKSLETEVCGVRNRMAFLGMPLPPFVAQEYNCTVADFGMTETTYQSQMCGPGGLRAQVNDLNIESIAGALCALVPASSIPNSIKNDPNASRGLDECSSKLPQSQMEFSQKIFEKEMALADKEIASAEDARKRLEVDLGILTARLAVSTATALGLEIAAKTAESVAVGVASIPTVAACACGMSSGVITTTDPSKSAIVIAQITREAQSAFVQGSEFVLGTTEKILAAKREAEDLKIRLSKENLSKEIKNFHALQAIAEITGRSLNFQKDIQSAIVQKGSIIVDCDRDLNKLTEAKALLLTEHDRLLAQIASSDLRASNLERSILNEKSVQAKEDGNMRILALEERNVEIDQSNIDLEIKTLERLKDGAVFRKDLIAGLKGKIESLDQEQKAASKALEEINKLSKEKLLAISEREYEQIAEVIRGDTSQTKKLLEIAKELNGLTQVDANLRDELTNFNASIEKQVKEEREKVLNTLYMQKEDVDGGNREKLFMATQEQMAALTKSVPAFIAQKRESLAEANRLLILLRNQVTALSSLQGTESPLSLGRSNPIIYMKNSDDLNKIQNIIEEPLWSNDQAIPMQTSKILVPSGSGLARSLAKSLRAEFDVSPSAQNQMDKTGYFSLWSSDFNIDPNGLNQNLLLVDVNMLVNFPACPNKAPKIYVLKHKGTGFVFKDASARDRTPLPSLVVSNERRIRATPYYVNFSGSELERIWNGDSKYSDQLNAFLDPVGVDGNSVPPLLGLPLIGNYELILPSPSPGCSYEDASFELYFTYAMKQRDN